MRILLSFATAVWICGCSCGDGAAVRSADASQVPVDGSVNMLVDADVIDARRPDGSACGTEHNAQGCPCEFGNSRQCHAGDPSKAGIGVCSFGQQQCDQRSAEFDFTWGACTGSVGPTAERCDERDNDCDGTTDENACATCIAAGEMPQQSGSLIGTRFSHCISSTEEAAGLSVGRVIGSTDVDVHWSVSSVARACCSQQLRVEDYENSTCGHGIWRIVCL